MDSHLPGGPLARARAFAFLFVGAVALSSLVVVFAAVAPAAAQCAEGRVANPQTEGRCCWPGQTWSPETSLCTGAPACPAGRVSQGDDCVLSAGVGAAPGASQPVEGAVEGQGTAGVPVAPAGYGAPQAQAQPQPYYQQPAQAQPVEMRTVTTINKGLVVSGAIIFGVSYFTAVIGAVGSEYGLLAIPIAGPFILMSEVNDGADGAGYAYMGLTFWGLAQAIGITLFVLGLTLKHEVEVRADLGEGRSIALTPYDVPGGGGLQLVGEF